MSLAAALAADEGQEEPERERAAAHEEQDQPPLQLRLRDLAPCRNQELGAVREVFSVSRLAGCTHNRLAPSQSIRPLE